MALPNINIQLGNGGLGLVIPTNDALAGMILQGPAPASLDLLQTVLITSLQAAVDLGITAAYDTANGKTAHKNIRLFYETAGTGAQLWIMFVSEALNMATILDVAEPYAVKLLNAAGGGIRMLTVVRDPATAYSPSIVTALDEDVLNAATKAQALALSFTQKFKPLRVIVPGYGYNGTAGDLPDLKTRTNNRVAILLGDTIGGLKSAVGVLLGRLASDPVQRNPGRVKSGSLPILAGFIGTETVDQADGDVDVIDGKGFITLRKHIGLSGFYFTNDHTAAAATDDYRSLARGRIIDKAIFLAYTVYVNELLDEIRVDPINGRIERGQAKFLQQIVDRQINESMTANDEIISVSVFVDATQNILSTGKICIKLRIVPFGYANAIEIDLGFSNPALN